MSFVSRAVLGFLLALVRVYRAFSTRLMPPVCRFHPTCSAYALQALEVHGPWKGSALAASRICRCHPFNDGGIDPVPQKTGS